MSSHHIVRDNQEPALILQGVHPPWALVQELLEWAPTVVVCEDALEEVLTWGIKLDAVVCNSSAKNIEPRVEHQQPIAVISSSPDKCLQASLQFLASRRHVTVNIVCDTPDWNLIDQYKDSFTMVIYTQGKRWSFIRNGRVEKFVPAGTAYSLRITGRETKHQSESEKIKVEQPQPFWLGEELDY